jgi:hypothetical protein
VTIASGEILTVTARPVKVAEVPTTPTTAATPAPSPSVGLPVIHVNGYWTFVPGREATGNPVPLLVHTEAFNTGDAGAREVKVAASFWYQGRMVCWHTVYLGTLAAGGHDTTDTLVSCTLPSGFSGRELELQFGDPAVTG